MILTSYTTALFVILIGGGNLGVIARPPVSSPILDSGSDNEVTNSTAATTDTWACHIRTWVRAPDLVPGSTQPAEARLAANGSSCSDIVSWQVGLRFKERAIVKFKSRTADALPVRPLMKPYEYLDQPNGLDFDSIYVTNPFATQMHNENDRYEEEVREYNMAMSNRSLWEVYGAERAVFDIKQALPLPHGGISSFIDTMQAFAIHMPFTNFPPIAARIDDFSSSRGDQELYKVETELQYYHLIGLANGTALDIPAGRAAFLPLAQPNVIDSLDMDNSMLSEKAQVLDLENPRLVDETGTSHRPNRMWFMMEERENFRYPKCDEGSLAKFHIEVQPLSTPAVQGKNVTLDVTVTRTGNGTEHPLYLDVGHVTTTNETWVWKHAPSEAQYNSLVNNSLYRDVWSFQGSQAKEMLMAFDETALFQRKENEKKQQVKRGRVVVTMYSNSAGCSSELPSLRPGYTRFLFENGDNKVEYQIKLDMAIAYNDYPTFQTTFQTFRSTLDFELGTTFLCAKKDTSQDNNEMDNIGTSHGEGLAEDDMWTPYSLYTPPPKEDPEGCQNSLAFQHRPVHSGTMYLDAITTTSSPSTAGAQNLYGQQQNRLSSDRQASQGRIVHYLDPKSLAPILTRYTNDTVEYSSLNQRLRQEEEAELLRSRYKYPCHWDNYPQSGNTGGGWMHAAKVWQSKEMRPAELSALGLREYESNNLPRDKKEFDHRVHWWSPRM